MGKRGRADLLPGLLDRPAGRDELVVVAEVDPVEAGETIGGDETRTCTSVAPPSKSIATSWRIVVPRTIESSTTTTRLPDTSSSGLNFSLIPCSRSPWSGWMNVRPT